MDALVEDLVRLERLRKWGQQAHRGQRLVCGARRFGRQAGNLAREGRAGFDQGAHVAGYLRLPSGFDEIGHAVATAKD